jgi:selenocysteine-specific elongation factor
LLSASRTDSGETAAVLHADGPIPLQVGDRFVLREVGRRAVVAGGRVLDPDPPRRGAALLAAVSTLRAASSDPDHRARALLEVRGRADLGALAAETGGGRPRDVLVAADQAMSPGAVATALTTARTAVAEFHAANPLRPGIPKASLAERLGIGPTLLEVLLDTEDDLSDAGAVVHTAGFEARLDPEAEAVWADARARLRESGFAVPRVAELGLDVELFRALVRRGELIEVSGELAYLPERLEELAARVRDIPGPFTVAEFRDLLGITRKYAVPLLEWLDREGITRRRGDEREVRP